jgi:hypothetical protein
MHFPGLGGGYGIGHCREHGEKENGSAEFHDEGRDVMEWDVKFRGIL